MAVTAAPAGVKFTRNTVARDEATGRTFFTLEFEYMDGDVLRRSNAQYEKAPTDAATPEDIVNAMIADVYDIADIEPPTP